jgi:hypothetical protein
MAAERVAVFGFLLWLILVGEKGGIDLVPEDTRNDWTSHHAVRKIWTTRIWLGLVAGPAMFKHLGPWGLYGMSVAFAYSFCCYLPALRTYAFVRRGNAPVASDQSSLAVGTRVKLLFISDAHVTWGGRRCADGSVTATPILGDSALGCLQVGGRRSWL